MNYLILGEDSEKKTAQMTELRQKFLPSDQARKFDYDLLEGASLAPDILKKSFLALPAVAAARFILLKSCHKLSPHNKQLCCDFLASQPTHAVLVLESAELKRNDSFLKQVTPFVKIIDFSSEKKENVFDLTRWMERGKCPEALRILEGLLDDGAHPLQIMGGVVWFWGQQRPRLTAGRFEQGLLILQEADLNLKRSRIQPDQAMELLVVKLCSILG